MTYDAGGIGPRHDLPFSDDVIGYCAKRLIALGLKVDREWLTAGNSSILDVLTLGDQAKIAAEARLRVPKSSAIWETSDFYRWAMPLAVFDLLNGPFLRFEEFEFLYLRILGESARAWLPSLFLAASSSPTLGSARRYCLLRALDMKALSCLDE